MASQPISRPRSKTFTASLLLALAYFATGRLGLMLPAFGSNITLIWLPTGIAVAALYRFGFGCWPGITLGSIAVNLAVGTPWPVALGISLGSTLGPVLAAWALRRMGFHPSFDRPRDIALLAVAAALGMLVSASGGVAALSAGGMLADGRLAAWLFWWGGDAMGVIAAAPLVFTFTRDDGQAIIRRGAGFAIWLLATCAVTLGVFVFNRGSAGGPWALAFVPLPFVAWAALRFGGVGTSFALIVLSIGAAYGTATGTGPFFRVNPVEGAVVLWIYMATSAVLGWLVSALHVARVEATGIRQLFEQALSDVSLGVLLAGLDRRITYANEGFTRLTGYTEAELLGRSCSLLHGPKSDPATVEKLKLALHGECFFDGEILNYRKDGTTFWNALLISPVRDERGVMTGFLGIQRDVTGRKQAEQALHLSEEHLRTIINLEPECVKLISPEGRLLEMNPAGLSMIEAGSLDEVRGCAITELIVPEDRAAFSELHRRAMQGETARCEFAIVSLKGTRRLLETHAVPYRDARGEIGGVLGITRDVTETRGAAAELERSYATLQLFIDTVPAYISFVDAEERYRLVNRRYEEYFGKSARQLIGKQISDVQTAAAYAEMRPHVRAALAGKTVRYQTHATSPDGKSHWFDVQYVPRRGEDGAASGFFVLVFDITENKKAEVALHDSRSRLDSILNSMKDVVWSASPDGRASNFVSASVQAMYGRSASEFMADPMKWLAMIHPEDRAAVERAFHKMSETGEFDVECRVLRDDGSVRWVHDRGRIVKDDSGQPLRFDGIVTDITGRKEAQATLLEREERLRAALSASGTGTFRWNIRTNELDWDEALDGLFGLPRGQTVRSLENFIAMVHPDDRPGVIERCERCAREGADFSMEFRVFWPDGSLHWLDDRGKTFSDAVGKPLYMTGACVDITGRKRAEESLHTSVEFTRSLIGSMQDGFSVLDANGVQTDVNPAFCEMTGFTREELIGRKPPYPYWPPEEHVRILAALGETMKGNFTNLELTFMRRNGERFPVILSPSAVRNQAGETISYSATVKDITERERAERALQETQKLESLGVLAGGIAHDFNNLLTTILGNASIATMDLADGRPVRECLDEITNASLRAAELCKQMLAYSGRGRFVIQKIDLGELVEQTAEMLKISTSKKAVIYYRLEKGLAPVEADATQLRQVIMNLVINASEAIGDKGGLITISTGMTHLESGQLRDTQPDANLPGGDYVFLEVADTGCGMSAETQARIFEPFFTTKFTGRGLGLAATLGIVRGHKGAMTVRSEEGRGTSFKLFFPAAAGPSEPLKEPPVEVPRWFGAGTVLVVDDEEAMRATVSRMMNMMGLEPVLAADGREAVDVFRANPGRFAMVLLDLTMPEMDGEQTFAELRRIDPAVRVVLMSGYNANEVLARFDGKGLAGFLQKPFLIDALRSIMQEALEGETAASVGRNN